jgi:hypothetical protein
MKHFWVLKTLKYTQINMGCYSLNHLGSYISYPRTVTVFDV